MRRRPIAVYRVIDEEELLGGDGIDASYAVADPPTQALSVDGAAVRPVAWRQRSAHWKGWASTAVAVVALAAVAVLLLSGSTHARALVAASATSPRIRSKRPPQRIWRVVPAAAPAPAQATRRAIGRGRLRAGHRSRTPRRGAMAAVAARRLVLSAGASRPVAAPGPAPSAQPLPDEEFGFER